MDISVIIPAYNREKSIERCLNSIINQTYKPLEIIVVDDCSTDDTVSKVKEYKCDYLRVIECKENHGAQRARNIGIREAKGDWIAFLDSDDEWYPDKLENQIKALEKTKYTVCSGGALVKRGNTCYEWFCQGKSGDVYEDILSFSTYIFFSALLVKKDCLADIGYLDEKVPAYQELDTAIQLLKTEKLAYVEKPLFIYHYMEAGSISKNRYKGIRGRKYLFEKYRSIITQKENIDVEIAWYRAFAGDYGWCSVYCYIYIFKWLFTILKKYMCFRKKYEK